MTDLESNTVLSDPKHACGVLKSTSTRKVPRTDEPVPGAKPSSRTVESASIAGRRSTRRSKRRWRMPEEHSVGIGVDAAITAQFAKRTEGGDEYVDNRAYALASADLSSPPASRRTQSFSRTSWR